MSTYKLVIPGNTPSQKNSKAIRRNKKTGQPFITSSDTFARWYPQALQAVSESPLVMKEWKYPLQLSFHFIRDSHRKFDYINIGQAVQDLLVKARIIENDDMLHVIPKEWSYQVKSGAGCCVLTIEEK